MKCPRCGGKGEYMREFGGSRPCEYCNGTGEVWQTNEEWRRTCSAEELAKFLTDIVQDAVTYTGGRNFTTKEDDKRYWLKWLKEKHDEHI